MLSFVYSLTFAFFTKEETCTLKDESLSNYDTNQSRNMMVWSVSATCFKVCQSLSDLLAPTANMNRLGITDES